MAPPVRIEVVSAQPEGDQHGRWRVSWLVANEAAEPLELHAAWIPHGRFRGDGHLPLALSVPGGGSARLEFAVATAGAAGEVIRNAFLILQLSGPSGGSTWRVFTRMRVEFDAQARPKPIVELVTSQSVQSDTCP